MNVIAYIQNSLVYFTFIIIIPLFLNHARKDLDTELQTDSKRKFYLKKR